MAVISAVWIAVVATGLMPAQATGLQASDQAAYALVNGCITHLGRGLELSEGLKSLPFEAVTEHPRFPVDHRELSVWRARSGADAVFVYTPVSDSSECYISVYGADFRVVSRSLGQALGDSGSPFEMKGSERVAGTNAMMVRYDSTLPAFPATLTMIMNAFAGDAEPTVQVAVKRLDEEFE